MVDLVQQTKCAFSSMDRAFDSDSKGYEFNSHKALQDIIKYGKHN